LNQKIKAQQTEMKHLEDQLNEERTKHAQTTQANSRLLKSSDITEAQNKDLETRNKNLANDVQKLQHEKELLENERKQFETKQTNFEKENKDHENKMNDLNKQCINITNLLKQNTQALTNEQTKLQQALDDNAKQLAQIQSLQIEAESVDQTTQQIIQERNDLAESVQSLKQKETQELETKMQIQIQNNELQESLSSQQTHTAREERRLTDLKTLFLKLLEKSAYDNKSAFATVSTFIVAASNHSILVQQIFNKFTATVEHLNNKLHRAQDILNFQVVQNTKRCNAMQTIVAETAKDLANSFVNVFDDTVDDHAPSNLNHQSDSKLNVPSTPSPRSNSNSNAHDRYHAAQTSPMFLNHTSSNMSTPVAPSHANTGASPISSAPTSSISDVMIRQHPSISSSTPNNQQKMSSTHRMESHVQDRDHTELH
jgi:chromosome segregation ATPase